MDASKRRECTGDFRSDGFGGGEGKSFENQPERGGIVGIDANFIEAVGIFFVLEIEGLVVHEGSDAVEELGAIDAAPTGARIPSASGGVERSIGAVGGIVVAAGDVVTDGATDLIDGGIKEAERHAEGAAEDGVESGQERASAAGAGELVGEAVDKEPILGAGAAVGNHCDNIGDKTFGGFVALTVGDAGDAGAGLIGRNREILAGAAAGCAGETADMRRGTDIAPDNFGEEGGRGTGGDGASDDRAADASDPGSLPG